MFQKLKKNIFILLIPLFINCGPARPVTEVIQKEPTNLDLSKNKDETNKAAEETLKEVDNSLDYFNITLIDRIIPNSEIKSNHVPHLREKTTNSSQDFNLIRTQAQPSTQSCNRKYRFLYPLIVRSPIKLPLKNEYFFTWPAEHLRKKINYATVSFETLGVQNQKKSHTQSIGAHFESQSQSWFISLTELIQTQPSEFNNQETDTQVISIDLHMNDQSKVKIEVLFHIVSQQTNENH